MQAIIFTGIQASGKTTFYKEHFLKTHLRISLDMLRTRHREQTIFNCCVTAKADFVIDNTNPLRSDRARYIKAAREAGYEIIGYNFLSDLSGALQRNRLRTDNEIIPEAGIRATHRKLELPAYDEGFDKLYEVIIGINDKFIVKERKR